MTGGHRELAIYRCLGKPVQPIRLRHHQVTGPRNRSSHGRVRIVRAPFAYFQQQSSSPALAIFIPTSPTILLLADPHTQSLRSLRQPGVPTELAQCHVKPPSFRMSDLGPAVVLALWQTRRDALGDIRTCIRKGTTQHRTWPRSPRASDACSVACFDSKLPSGLRALTQRTRPRSPRRSWCVRICTGGDTVRIPTASRALQLWTRAATTRNNGSLARTGISAICLSRRIHVGPSTTFHPYVSPIH